MAKALSAKLYAQVQAGMLRNSDGSTYSNYGPAVGTEIKLKLDDKNALIGNMEVGAFSALTADARIGYQRALGKNANLVFTANASVNKSVEKEEESKLRYEHYYSVHDEASERDFQDSDIGTKTASWYPGNLRLFGQTGIQKNTKWGGYEVGAEYGYRKSLSSDFNKTYDSSVIVEANGQTYSEVVQFKHSRTAEEGFYFSPYGAVKVNLSTDGAMQAIGKADMHEAKIGIRYTF